MVPGANVTISESCDFYQLEASRYLKGTSTLTTE